MRWRAYPKYKHSGVEWLGEVPEYWDVEATRRYLVNHKQGYYSSAPYVDEGVKLLRISDFIGDGRMSTSQCPRVEENEDLAQYLLREGDFVFARTGGAGSFAMIEELIEPIAFAAYLIKFRFKEDKVYLPFLRFFFMSTSFQFGIARSIHGGVNQNVHAENIKSQFCSIPPLPEQIAIADFLCREAGRLDILIAKKQALIELLKEKRAALILQTVTRGLPAGAAEEFGLEPHTRFKDSGIEWLGEIPNNWDLTPLRYAFHNQDYRRIPLSGVDRAEMEKLYPYYGASGIIDFVENYIFDETLIIVAEDGANLLSRSTPLAFLASGKYWVNNHAHILKPVSGDINYWVSVLQAFDYTSLITGAAQPKLTADRLGSIILPKPSEGEQAAIATYLDRETTKIDNLISKVETIITRLQEYRTALITAAVTGKIDVRQETA